MKTGLRPGRPCKGKTRRESVTICIDSGTLDKARVVAARNDSTLSGVIATLLDKYISEHENPHRRRNLTAEELLAIPIPGYTPPAPLSDTNEEP